MSAPCGKAASCEECPFPDCEWDGVSPEDWSAAKECDLQARHAKENKVAAQRRAYYEANKEKVAAYDRLIELLEAWRNQEKGLTRALLGEVIELVEQQPEKEEEP